MPQMPAHSQFMPRNLPGQQAPTQPGSNPLNDLSAAYAAAAAAAAASGYPGAFNPSQQQPGGEATNPALAMFSQFQNGVPVDPRAAGFMNGMAPGNPLAAAAAYAQYCNDPMAAQMMAGGAFPYSPQASHLSAPGTGPNPSTAAYQNLMMNMPGNNSPSGNQISAGHNNDQSGNGSTRRKNATRETTATLKAWLYEHRKNPYPTKGEKIMLAIITKMSLNQVSTWFANARRRLKKENKMTFSPRNRTAEDIDSDDEQTGSGKKNGKKNGSTSSDNMNFDDLDDLDDINDEELEGENDEDNEDNDSFSYNSENKPGNNKQNPHHQPLANNNNSQNLIQKHGLPGMHHPHHGHHPYFSSQQLQLQQQALQQQQHAAYLQSLFPQHAGQIDANKMMSMMLNSSGMFANQSPLASTENKNHHVALASNPAGTKNPASLFIPPVVTKPNQSSTSTNNKSASSNSSNKPKIWSLADVATNNGNKSNGNKSLNNSLSSLSSSSLSSSSSSSNSSTNNYYAPVSPALKSHSSTNHSPQSNHNLSQPLNINANSNAMTPSSTSAPLSSSSSSQQNQSPKSTSSSNSDNTVQMPQNPNKYGLMAQQHQQLLSFFAAAAASQSDASSGAGAQPNFHQIYLQQLTSQMHGGGNPFSGNSFLTQGLIQQMAKHQQDALLLSQKNLDSGASTNNDSAEEVESLEVSAEANKSVEKTQAEVEDAEQEPKATKSLKHKLENEDEDEEEEEVVVKRQKTTTTTDAKKQPTSFTVNTNKLFKTISSTGSDAETADSDNEHEDEDGEAVSDAGNKSFDSLASNEHKKSSDNKTSLSAGLLIKQQQSNTTSKPATIAVATNKRSLE